MVKDDANLICKGKISSNSRKYLTSPEKLQRYHEENPNHLIFAHLFPLKCFLAQTQTMEIIFLCLQYLLYNSLSLVSMLGDEFLPLCLGLFLLSPLPLCLLPLLLGELLLLLVSS